MLKSTEILSNWNQLIKIKKDLLEEVLNDFNEYEVTDPKARAIITGKIEGLWKLESINADK